MAERHERPAHVDGGADTGLELTFTSVSPLLVIGEPMATRRDRPGWGAGGVVVGEGAVVTVGAVVGDVPGPTVVGVVEPGGSVVGVGPVPGEPVYSNAPGMVTSLPTWSATVTSTNPFTGDGGVRTRTRLLDLDTICPTRVPNSTRALSTKPAPETVTSVPPAVGPDLGPTKLIVMPSLVTGCCGAGGTPTGGLVVGGELGVVVGVEVRGVVVVGVDGFGSGSLGGGTVVGGVVGRGDPTTVVGVGAGAGVGDGPAVGGGTGEVEPGDVVGGDPGVVVGDGAPGVVVGVVGAEPGRGGAVVGVGGSVDPRGVVVGVGPPGETAVVLVVVSGSLVGVPIVRNVEAAGP